MANNNPLLPVAVAFILGIIAGDAAYASYGGMRLVVVIILLLMVSIVVGILTNRRHPLCSSAAVLIASFFFGAALLVRESMNNRFIFSEAQEIEYEAVVTSNPKVAGKTLRCDLSLTAIDGHALHRPVKVKAAILRDTVTNDWQHIKLGCGLAAVSPMERLYIYRPNSNFDYVRWLRVHGFTAQTFIYYRDWDLARVSLKPLSWFDRLQLRAMQLRARVVDRFVRMTGSSADDQGAAIVASMVLGDRHAISRQTKELYSVTGASHVLALSGLHLGIIYTVLTLLFGRIRRPWISQALILSAIWMYVVLVGMGTSIVRSAVMLSVFSFCQVLHRDGASVNTLSFAALCLLAVSPMSLWDISFQLSFVAVLSILIYYRPLNNLLYIDNKIIRAVWSVLIVSLSAQLGTAPLVAYYFGRFSTYFLLTNLLVVPFATAIIYASAALLIISPLSAVAAPFAHLLNMVARWFNTSLGWMASLPFASIDHIALNLPGLYLIYIGLFCFTAAAARLYVGPRVNVARDIRYRERRIVASLKKNEQRYNLRERNARNQWNGNNNAGTKQ